MIPSANWTGRRWRREGQHTWLVDSAAALSGLRPLSQRDARAVAWSLWSQQGLEAEIMDILLSRFDQGDAELCIYGSTVSSSRKCSFAE